MLNPLHSIPTHAASLTAAIAARAAAQPEAVSMTFLAAGKPEQVLTYRRLCAAARRMAARLLETGVKPGEVVVLAGEHNEQLIILFLAVLFLGATPAIAPYPTAFNQPALYRQRLLDIVTASHASLIVALPQVRDWLSENLSGLPCAVLDSCAPAADSATNLFPLDPILNTLPPDTPAYLQFSSGTTGEPKGAIVTHASALRHLHMLAEALNLTARDVLVGWAPFYHDLGLVAYLLLPLVSGLPLVTLAPDHWVRRPGSLLNALHSYRGTICIMPGFGFAHTTRNVRPREVEGLDLSCVRHLIAGAEVLQPGTLQAFASRFQEYGLAPDALQVGYGMTECVFMASLTPQGRPLHSDRIERSTLLDEQRAVPSTEPEALAIVSCGAPLPDITIEILDEQGVRQPERRVGEVVISSPALFERYLHRPELTRQALRQGRLYTGDLGYWADGELFIVDRKKDLIISTGRHIYPETLEQLVLAVLGEAGGRAAAFGVRSAELGTELLVLACEVRGQPEATERDRLVEAIRRQVYRDTDLMPADIRLVKRGWLEVTTSGKVARSASRDKYLAEGHSPLPATPALPQRPAQLEAMLLLLVAKMLGLESVKPEDDFFALGGDSLAALRLMLAVEKQLGVKVPLEFFQQPTVAHLAGLIGSQSEQPRQDLPQKRRPRPAPARPHSMPTHSRLVMDGPILRGRGLPYEPGVRLQRAWLALPGIQTWLFQREIALLHRWGERIGEPPGPAAIRQSLLANTWRAWRAHVLTAAPGTSPWVTLRGDPALWQPNGRGPGTIFLVLHSPLNFVFVRSCKAGRLDTLIIHGALDKTQDPERDRSAQVYQAYQTLRRGGTVIIGGDGVHGEQGIPVPFFGGQRLFRQGGAELAVQTGARLVPVFCTIATTGQVTVEVCAPLTGTGGSASLQVQALTRVYAELVVERWPQIYPQLAWGHLARRLKELEEGPGGVCRD